MPSFATITAFATLAFAALGSALPHAPLNAGANVQTNNADVNVHRRDSALPVDKLLGTVTHATGKRDLGLDILTAIASHLGIEVEDLINVLNTKVSVLDGGNIGVANAHAIQSRGELPYTHLSADDIKAITAIASHFGVDVDELLTIAENKVSILHGADISALNAVAHQSRAELTDFEVAKDVKKALPGTKLSRGETRSFPTVIVEVIAKVEAIAAKIRAVVSANVDVGVNVDVVVSLLHELEITVSQALAEVKILVENPIDGVLTLEGKVLSIEAVAQIVATLTTSVVVALGLVVKAVATVKADVSVCLDLVAQIGVALAAIISVSVKLAAGILVHLVPLIKVVAKIIIDLKLTALIEVLGLSQGY